MKNKIRCLHSHAVRSERSSYRCVLEIGHKGKHEYGIRQ